MPKDSKEKKTNDEKDEAFSIDPVFSKDTITTDEAVEQVEKEDTPKEESPKETHLRSIEQPNAWRRCWRWFWDKKLVTIPALILVIAAILVAIPLTRYAMLGWFWKETVTITIIDDGNNRPVTEATVKLAGMSTKTNAKGVAAFDSIPVGMHELTIEKKNYQTASKSVEIQLFATTKAFNEKIHATGRMTDLAVINRLSGAGVKAALVAVSQDDKAKTDDTGKAQVVIPADKKLVSVTVTAEGYLDQKIEIAPSKATTIELVPAGKMYFLSKQRGKLDVVKTNLDGSDRQIVVEGTGHEIDGDTTLLASRDWRYLLLKAKREAGKSQALYLYDTTKNGLELIDQGANANFIPVGWSGHNFFYHVYRDDKARTDKGQEAVKMVNAQNRKMAIIDESDVMSASPYLNYRQQFLHFYILDGGIVYNRQWVGGTSAPTINGLNHDIVRVNSDGGGKKVIKSFQASVIDSIQGKLYEPQEVYYKINKIEQPSKPVYAELENWVYREGVSVDNFDSTIYPTYLMSPDGTMSFWSEPRDGKNTLLIGGKNAENEQALASVSEFKAYGWLTNEYILMQKNNSELYIASPAQLKAGKAPLKISDYHKPSALFLGYGYGYGGQ